MWRSMKLSVCVVEVSRGYDLLLILCLLVSLFSSLWYSLQYIFTFFVCFYLFCFLVECNLTPHWLSCFWVFYWISLSSVIIIACLSNHNVGYTNAIISFYTFIVIVLWAETSWVNLRVSLNVILSILMLLSKLYP